MFSFVVWSFEVTRDSDSDSTHMTRDSDSDSTLGTWTRTRTFEESNTSLLYIVTVHAWEIVHEPLQYSHLSTPPPPTHTHTQSVYVPGSRQNKTSGPSFLMWAVPWLLALQFWDFGPTLSAITCISLVYHSSVFFTVVALYPYLTQHNNFSFFFICARYKRKAVTFYACLNALCE